MLADPFVILLAGHYAGDYLLQTDWISGHKAERSVTGWLANSAHVACHVAVTLALLLVTRAATGLDYSAAGAVAALAWIGFSHGLIDRRWPVERWMRATGSTGYLESGRGAPMVDQALHVVVGLFPAALLLAAL
ncbi:DUF3307 domain-containing protein [Streptomyces sp. CBMA156]|uniref:DUF3307 domain-containing protein n=1 Tax=Streptomyces sp. CBMA156 TaxID=1930280 RepID=UPI001662063E|nr:DUF3307 domain-containing protein [Streptomyces sp. CBMA156]MBD0675461.1 hypothetical protein [Streptomyces sp. CBMA156]